MSRSAIAGTIAVCFVAAVVAFTIRVLPRMFAEHEARMAASEATGPAIHDAIHEAASEAGRKAAGDVANKIPAGLHEGGAGTRSPNADKALPGTHEGAGASTPNPIEAPISVQRAAFTITLPPGSSVNPETTGIGSERMVIADLPEHSMIGILVADKKEQAAKDYVALLAKFRGVFSNAQEDKPDAFDAIRPVRATAVKGRIKTVDSVFEIGQCEGWDKTCTIYVEYPAEDKAKIMPLMTKALATFRMKQ